MADHKFSDSGFSHTTSTPMDGVEIAEWLFSLAGRFPSRVLSPDSKEKR